MKFFIYLLLLTRVSTLIKQKCSSTARSKTFIAYQLLYNYILAYIYTLYIYFIIYVIIYVVIYIRHLDMLNPSFSNTYTMYRKLAQRNFLAIFLLNNLMFQNLSLSLLSISHGKNIKKDNFLNVIYLHRKK